MKTFLFSLTTWIFFAAQMFAQQGRVVDIQATDIVYEPNSKLILASVRSQDPQHPNSITAIDPLSGSIQYSISVGANPYKPVLTDDKKHLYFAVEGQKIQRIDLASKKIDLEFVADFGPTRFISNCPPPWQVSDMRPMPGHPDTLAVALYCKDWNQHEGIGIFDNGIRRPIISPGFTNATFICFDSSPDTLWGNGEDFGYSVWRFKIDRNGVTVWDEARGSFNILDPNLQMLDERIYTTNGRVIDPWRNTVEGRFYSFETVRALSSTFDRDASRVYFIERDGYDYTLSEFDLRTYRLTGYYRVTNSTLSPMIPVYDPSKLIRCGEAGLAVRDAGFYSPRIVILPLSLLNLSPHFQPAQPVPLNNALRHIAIPASDLVYDSVNRLIYASVPGTFDDIGNSIVPIDPFAGSVGNAVWVGSEPWQLMISDGGQFLYSALYGANSIRRLRLPGLVPDILFPLFTDPGFGYYDLAPTPAGGLLPVPEMPGSAIVLREDQTTDTPESMGVAVYDDGKKRLTTIPNWPQAGPVDAIQLSSSGNMVYGLNNENTSFDFFKMALDSSGIRIIANAPGVGSGFFARLKCQNDLCFTSDGLIIDPVKMVRLRRFQFDFIVGNYSPNDVALDLQHGRVYFLTSTDQGTAIEGYDVNTMAQVSTFKNTSIKGPSRSFLIWNNDQFAFAAPDGVYLLPISLLQPVTSH